ncbi:hypothetical protein ACLKA7_000753 [Drosophila subpalustris]
MLSNVNVNECGYQLVEDLRNDLGNEKFSLLIDESTDISITKILGVAIIYYTLRGEDIVDSADSGCVDTNRVAIPTTCLTNMSSYDVQCQQRK